MKTVLVIIFFVFCLNSQGQNNMEEDTSIKFVLPLKSKIVTNDQPCKKAIVHIYNAYSFNAKSDTNTVIQTIELDDDGILELEIPDDGSFILEVTKEDFIHKRFKINTENVPKELWSKKFAGFSIESIELFKPVEGIDYSLFDFPLILIEFDVESDNFYYNEEYSDLALKAIDAIKFAEAKQALLSENKYADKNTLATKLMLLSIGLGLLCILLITVLIFTKRK